MGKIPAEWGDSRIFCLNPIFPPQYSAKLGMTREPDKKPVFTRG
jgi:hypothetical protein